MSDESYSPLYLAGIEHFNVCDFYESHEVWEELWTDYQGPSRKFYQGLIQAAVALHHFGNGNTPGVGINQSMVVSCPFGLACNVWLWLALLPQASLT